MTRGTKTTTIVLAGAVALASGAYALGSQAGDGAAVAAKSTTTSTAGPPPGRPCRGDRPGFDALATRLGVKDADLRAAIEDVAKAHRDDVARTLADALGIDRAKVEAAFEKRRSEHGDHHRDFAAALATKLGLSTAKVQAALDTQRDHRGGPAALAKALGVSTAKLKAAVADLWREHRPPDRRRGEDALAKTLGVTAAQLRAAFEQLRATHEQLRDTFATELAKRLNLDVAKVKSALDDLGPFGRRHP